MTYSEALQWKTDHVGLIGQIDEKCFVVSELLIVPTDKQRRDVFLREYLFSDAKEEAILPYVSDDVQVWSIDLKHLESDDILFYNVLAE